MWNKPSVADATPLEAWRPFFPGERRHVIKYMSPGHEDNRR